jgi:flavin reductase (DIM6/NTAB) family NADH-FMN oxidoreductase RutF
MMEIGMLDMREDEERRVRRYIDAKVDVDESGYDKLASPVASVVMVTTIDADGRCNAAPMATCIRNNHNPTCFEFTVDADKDTAQNVIASGQFTVNTVPFERDIIEKVQLTALRMPEGIDELAAVGLTSIPARVVRPPRIGECRSHFECVVEWTKRWFEKRITVVGRVVAASVDRDCIDDKGFVRHERLLPTQYAGLAYGPTYFGGHQAMVVPVSQDGLKLKTLSSAPTHTSRR